MVLIVEQLEAAEKAVNAEKNESQKSMRSSWKISSGWKLESRSDESSWLCSVLLPKWKKENDTAAIWRIYDAIRSLVMESGGGGGVKAV